MSSSTTATPPEAIKSPISKSHASPQLLSQRVLTPVVVCGSPCTLPTPKEGLLPPLLSAAAACHAAANHHKSPGGTTSLLQNSVPASESEKLTATSIYVLRELERPRPRPADIESTVCPPAVEPFRKAWWAGVRPTTCERTCRHRSKVCDAIQLCNDCTGYYCKWLAELVGIPVLKASGRVDPVIFEKDKLAKLYWERISKVACCPKLTAKCLMCIRRYQLFTHFLPGNLDFRSLVHESVMKLHEEGFAVDMGLIRKVTRRHLECIADSMELCLPVEYVSSYQAYDIIVRRGPLVDVLANGISSALQSQNIRRLSSTSSSGESSARYLLNASQRAADANYSPSALAHSTDALIKQAPRKDTTSSTSDSIGSSPPRDNNGNDYDDDSCPPHLRKKMRRNLNDDIGNEDNTNQRRRSRRQVRRRPAYNNAEEIYYNEDQDFLSMLDENDQAEDSEDSENNGRRRKRKTRGSNISGRRPSGMATASPGGVLGFGLDEQFAPATATRRDSNSSFENLVDQFRSSLDNEVSIDTETIQMLFKKSGGNRMNSPEMYSRQQQVVQSPLGQSGVNDVKLEGHQPSRFDLNSGSPEAIDRLAAAVLQRFDQRPKRRRQSTVADAIHRRQLLEESRLGECGVRGVFWDPSKEGWCALLPMSPANAEEDWGSMKRKILCFSANTWKSFESAKWSAVYERLRRNPRELDFVSQDVREDLSHWVKENVEAAALSSSSHNENNEDTWAAAQAFANGRAAAGDMDLSQMDPATASALLNGLAGNGGGHASSNGQLAELIGSLSKQIAALGNNPNDQRQLQQFDSVTSTTAGETSLGPTTTTSTTSVEEQREDEKQQFTPTTIMGLLAALQSKLPAPDGMQQDQPLPVVVEGIKAEEDYQ